MNVELKLEVTANEFWGIIIDSLKQDMGTSAKIHKGLKFEKQLPTTLSGLATAQVEVVEYIENECYSVDFATTRSTVHSTYSIVEDGSGILVSYTEDETFAKTMDKWNAKLMKSLYKKSRTKKLLKKLRRIEQYIIGGR